MNETRLLERTLNICLLPNELKDIYTSINGQLEKLLNTSIEEGYILSIPTIKDYTTNTIHNTTGACIFRVVYDTEILDISIGREYNSIIYRVSTEGVFTHLYDIDILIPAPVLLKNGWEWNYESQTYIRNEKQLVKDSWKRVRITSMRYENNKYKCLGSP